MIYDRVGLPADWPDVAAVARVAQEREVGGKNTSTTHNYLTIYAGTAAEMGGLVRGHRGIENGPHWALDVELREDESRTQSGHAGENLGLIRRAAVSLLNRAGAKGSAETRRLRAGWDQEFLLQVLQGIPAI